MSFLMAVMAVTLVSALGLLALQSSSKSEASKPEPPKPAPPAPAPAPAPPPPAPPPPPPPPPAPPPPPPPPPPKPKEEEPPLSKIVGDMFDKIEKQVDTWKPASSTEVIKTLRSEIMAIIIKRELRK